MGCTGGQHRSVALAESTGEYLKAQGYRVSVAHRDLRLAEGSAESSPTAKAGAPAFRDGAASDAPAGEAE